MLFTNAWRKHALKVETLPDFFHIRQMLLQVRNVFQVPST